MKFSHIADVHIGSWRDPKMKILSTLAFIKAIDESIKEEVDFVLIAGDLFNTAIPGIDEIKTAIKKLKELNKKGIPVYYIAGSHDYSPSGKTMLDVIEEAGLGTDCMRGTVDSEGKLVLKFTKDEKTGAKITGVIGRRGMLERKYYESLNKKNLESENGFKIFMFHTSLDELKPKDLEKMESNPISFLPKGFDYYAGGHVHIVSVHSDAERSYQNVVYPGPTFPANFSELEKLGSGGFYIYNDGELIRKELTIKETVFKYIKVDKKSPEEAQVIIEEKIKDEKVEDKIVMLRIEGKLSSGSPTHIDFKKIFDDLNKKRAYFVMKNTSKLIGVNFEEIKTDTHSAQEVENKVINEHLGQTPHNFPRELETTKTLIKNFSAEKNEGEKQADYDERIKKDIDIVIK